MPSLPYDGSQLNATDASIATYTRIQYPNPFFDLSRHYFPKSVKTLLKFCRIFFYQNEFIHNIISKLASYPITDFIYEGLKDKAVKESYMELNDHHLRLKSFLIEVGLDYFVYGNCFISVNMKFKRFLECPICHDTQPVEKRKYRWLDYTFVGKCSACGNESVKFKIQDKYLRNPKYFKMLRWAPENITIDYDDLTGEGRYFYMMNERIRKQIMAGKNEVIERVPELFIKAVKESKKIELDPKNLYHFKRPTLAEEDGAWGKSILLPCMKMLWYMQTLRRGNEAIVADHLIPMRAIYPSSQGTLDPFCLDPNSWVYTETGIKQLKDVTLSDKLIAENGNLTEINTIKSMQLTNDNMIDVQIHGLPTLSHSATKKHPFKVRQGDNAIWKKAEELTTSDYMSIPRKEFAKRNDWIDIKDLIPKLRKHKHNLSNKFRFTNEFARLIGLYIAEGCATEHGKLEFCFHSKETDYYNFVSLQLDSLLPDTETKIIPGEGNYVQVQKYSVELQQVFAQLLGERCEKKTLRNLGHLTKSQAINVLKGIFEGDGTFFYENKRYPRLHLKSINLGLIVEIRDLLISLGYYPSIVEDRSYTDGEPVGLCYQLKLYGYQAERFADLLGWEPKYFYTVDNDINYLFIENYVHVKIKQIRKSHKKNYIALEVADPSHSYRTIAGVSHNTQMNLGQWRSNMEEQILKWRRDPNYLGIFPVPIGYESLGGDAKMLMVTPEMRYLEESIINALGVPIEFVKGGSTWTSSSVSLRIVENGFLNYREQLVDFLNFFVVPKIKYFLGYPPVTIKFKKFKMSDDVQAKELLLQLAQLGKLSDSNLLEEFGMDAMEEREYRKSDTSFNLDLQASQTKAQAEAQGRGTVIMARYQTLAQLAGVEEAARAQEQKFAKELIQELGIQNEDPSDVLQKQAILIGQMAPPQQRAILKQLQTKAPTAFSFLMIRLQNSGVLAAPQEERAMEMAQQEHEMKMQQTEAEVQKSKVEDKLSEKELERKKEEQKVKDKETARKMVEREQAHKHRVEESKLPAPKEKK